MKVILRISLGILVTAVSVASIYAAALQGPGGHQPPDPAHHAGGRLTAVAGNGLTVKNREGDVQQILVTADTTFDRNGQTAKLTDFVVDDFVFAEGTRDSSGTLVATHIGGGDKPPRHGGFPGPPADGVHAVAGKVVSVDTAARTLTLEGPDTQSEVVYTTDATEVARDRQPATLSDYKAGDHVYARGARNADGKFVADRIVGGDKPGPGRHHGDGE